jgi:hypothetical protein
MSIKVSIGRLKLGLPFTELVKREVEGNAVYGEYQITVDIESGVVHGDFPKRALRHVLEWLDLHQGELLENWQRVQARKPPYKIAPLE